MGEFNKKDLENWLNAILKNNPEFKILSIEELTNAINQNNLPQWLQEEINWIGIDISIIINIFKSAMVRLREHLIFMTQCYSRNKTVDTNKLIKVLKDMYDEIKYKPTSPKIAALSLILHNLDRYIIGDSFEENNPWSKVKITALQDAIISKTVSERKGDVITKESIKIIEKEVFDLLENWYKI